MKNFYLIAAFFLLNAISRCQDAWVAINSGLTTLDMLSIAVDTSGTLYAGTQGDGIFRSQDDCQRWIQIGQSTNLINVQEIATADNGGVYITAHVPEDVAVNPVNLIYYSSDRGETWTPRTDGLPGTTSTYVLTSIEFDSQDVEYLGYTPITGSGPTDPIPSGGLYRFSQQQNSWSVLSGSSPPESIAFDASNNIYIGTLRSNGGGIPLGGSDLVYVSHDNGASFLPMPRFTSCGCAQDVSSLAFDFDGALIAAVYFSPQGMYWSNPVGSPWIRKSDGLPGPHARVNSIVVRPQGDVFIAMANNPGNSLPNGIYRFSADSWSDVSSGLTNTDVTEIVVNSQGVLFAATRGGGVFRSTYLVPATLSSFETE